MKCQLELFPNEIFLCLFCYFSWNEILTSFWSLNKRLNSLIYSMFTINQCGIILIHPGLSYITIILDVNAFQNIKYFLLKYDRLLTLSEIS
jgi:hypothetical protein